MKPIGLVTCYFYHNYGSMLQAYATEMLMERMHVPFLTIACKRPRNYMVENKYMYYVKKVLNADWYLRLGKIKLARQMKKYPSFAENVRIRNLYFDDFSKEMFHVFAYKKLTHK